MKTQGQGARLGGEVNMGEAREGVGQAASQSTGRELRATRASGVWRSTWLRDHQEAEFLALRPAGWMIWGKFFTSLGLTFLIC
jgi:hypothetical protein